MILSQFDHPPLPQRRGRPHEVRHFFLIKIRNYKIQHFFENGTKGLKKGHFGYFEANAF